MISEKEKENIKNKKLRSKIKRQGKKIAKKGYRKKGMKCNNL